MRVVGWRNHKGMYVVEGAKNSVDFLIQDEHFDEEVGECEFIFNLEI